MNKLSAILTLGATLTTTVWAGALQRDSLSADTKWLLHFDAEAFQATQLGGWMGRDVLDKHLAKAKTDLKEQLNVEFDWRRITAITAYGTTYQPHGEPKGALLIYTDLDVKQGLEAALEKLAQAGAGETGPLKRLEPDPLPLYSFKYEVFIAVVPGRPVILSKSHEEVVKARKVLLGQTPSLLASQAFTDLPTAPASFFFVAVAEGFNQGAHLPPHAKVLQMAESARATLGESGGQLSLNLALKTKDAETSQQIQQVVQGLVALVSLSQVNNQDLQQLAQAIKVTASDRLVSVELKFPVAEAIKKLQEQERKKHGGS